LPKIVASINGKIWGVLSHETTQAKWDEHSAERLFTADLSAIEWEKWFNAVPTDPYVAAYLVGRLTNCIDWLLVRAEFFCHHRIAQHAEPAVVKLIEVVHRLSLDADGLASIHRATERCVSEWKEVIESDWYPDESTWDPENSEGNNPEY
jgi:hypothetical protein